MDRSSLIFLARLAEEAERYDEMAGHMKAVATNFDNELSSDEGNLIAVAFKNEMGTRRSAWRVLRNIQMKTQDTQQAATTQAYIQRIEDEVRTLCHDLVTMIDDHLLPKASNIESQAFYHKMKGDYYLYLAEIAPSSDDGTSANQALESYEKARDLMSAELPPTHPLRLSLALNFSVFYVEILNAPDRGALMAKQSFDDAMGELDMLSEDNYRDTTLIMQLLRDNMTLWMAIQP
ncbi:hypothetical protein DYB37_010667 [Aphanomyces astaci]|uniref:14-3-3 domain-containing protein n=1 Tax=Aphanomyces astaci TaxID=112090 RepID=A0A3R6X438_APHAT|nr:hypothetical protein DYB35_012877 [Aphanomyces astaci]RHZ10702.1 hypothetical protein DYB37_010667 [Aphanomyces astaci]